jgi:hypothetical protein
VNNNSKITNVNHMNKLIVLYTNGTSEIYDEGIKDVNLKMI